MPDAPTLHAHIATRLRESRDELASQFAGSGPIRYCVLDGLFGTSLAADLTSRFPDASTMRLRNTFRERKYVSAQMDHHDPAIEGALFAFHQASVVDQVRGITGKADLQPDPELYAGGLSLMARGHFLNPHIDNSHDGARRRWRNLNLLYYLAPDWKPDEGGELELWPRGVRAEPTRIPIRHDRLVIMETHQQAWHSVRAIRGEQPRRCISNYYFGDTPMRADQDFHVTSFRGRPEQPLRDCVSRADSAARMLLRRIFRKGVGPKDHRYQR